MQARYRFISGIAGLCILLDQLSKFWAISAIPEHRAIVVIPGFFDLVNIRNRGAAFGFLNRSDIEWQFWLFLAATLVAVWAIFALARHSKRDDLLFSGLAFILGGAIGNLIDRIRMRAVIDFLDFYLGDWHWPAFNVADICICVGAGLVCLAMLRMELLERAVRKKKERTR